MKTRSTADHEFGLLGHRCCDGNGFIALRVCPGCAAIIGVCDEAGHVYARPHDVPPRRSGTSTWHVAARCPSCEATSLSTFRAATRDEALAAGFAWSELDWRVADDALGR